MSFAVELKERFDLVYRYFEDSTRDAEQVVQTLRERALLEETYANGLERLAGRLPSVQGTLLQALGALNADSLNRAAQARTLAEALTNDLAEPLVQFLKAQSRSMKPIYKDGRLLQGDLAAASARHTEAYSRYWQACHEAEETLIQLEIQKDASKWRAKLPMLRREVDESVRFYQASIAEYNQAKERYDKAIGSVLETYQQAAEARLDTLKDSLRKFVVYETSALRNTQYDLDQVAKAMESINSKEDIQLFVHTHKQVAELDTSYRFVEYQASSVAFQRFMEEQVPAESAPGLTGLLAKLSDHLFPEIQTEKAREAVEPIISKVWAGQILNAEDRTNFSILVREKVGRRAWAGCLSERRQQSLCEIKPEGFATAAEQMRTVLSECERAHDSSTARQCLIFAQTFFSHEPREFLESLVSGHPLWQQVSFWELMIQDNIEEELRKGGAGSDSERVKNVAFCQLATYANYMQSFHVDQMFAGELVSRLASKHDLSLDDLSTLMGIVDKDMLPPDVHRGVPRWLLELEGHVPHNLRHLSQAVQPASPDSSVSIEISPDRLSDVRSHVPRASLGLEDILEKSLPKQSPDRS
jgi:hypothetical protein